MGTKEHRVILEGSKGTRIPLGDPLYWDVALDLHLLL